MVEALMAEAAKLKEEQEEKMAGYNDFQKAFVKGKPLRWKPEAADDATDEYGLAA
jgi:hypothetical protein